MQAFTIKGHTLSVQVEGDPARPAVLLLHGFPDSHKLFAAQVEALRSSYRVIVPDLLGFGDSDKPQEVEHYTMDNFVAMLVELLDQLGVDKAAVAGHDFGSALAWHFAFLAPIRVSKLVPICVGCLGCFFAPGSLEAAMTQRQKSWYMLLFIQPAAEEVLTANDWALYRAILENHEIADAYIAEMSRPGALTAGLNVYRANVKPEAFGMLQPLELPQLQIPVMGVMSDDPYLTDDQMIASQRYVALGLWRYEKIVGEGIGHFVPRTAPEQLNALLLDFLKDGDEATLA